MKNIILSIAVALSFNYAGAHEGHEVPGVVKSIHGGTGLGGKQMNLEYVVNETELKIYPVSHEGKDIAATEVKVAATAKLPKGKAESLKLENKDGAYLAKIDFKNSHRVEVQVTTENAGKKDVFKFQVEK